MIIETLILCAFSAIIAYIVGLNSAKTLNFKYKGWKIVAWKGNYVDKYIISAVKDNMYIWFALCPNGDVEFHRYEIKNVEQR